MRYDDADRDREREGLVRFAASDHVDVRLGIVSDRRRQGKTYLLDAAVTTFGGFYFAATDATEADSLASFGRPLASFGDVGSGSLEVGDAELADLAADDPAILLVGLRLTIQQFCW